MADSASANLRHCWFCGRWMPPQAHPIYAPNGRTREHLLPRSRGGDNSAANTVWACLRCNGDKRDLTVEEYRAVMHVRTGATVVFWGETPAALAPDPLAPRPTAAPTEGDTGRRDR